MAGRYRVTILHFFPALCSKYVKKLLTKKGITLIQHPPYSPDLAPCDFWLFNKLKTSLGSFSDARSLKEAIKEALEKNTQKRVSKNF